MKLFATTPLSMTAAAVFALANNDVLAQAATVPAPAYELAYNVGVVSDYRYRGISQTRLQPAVQGGMDLTAGAWYAGAWASNIKWIKDAGGNANVEFDVYGGYKYELTKDIILDIGVLGYVFPSNKLATSANTTEVYFGVSSGSYSAKYSHGVSNVFGFGDSKGSGYLEANADYPMVKGTNLVGHVGRQTVKNNAGFSYTDYKVGVTHEALGGKFAASVIGTNNKNYTAPLSKNLGKASLVLGFTKTY